MSASTWVPQRGALPPHPSLLGGQKAVVVVAPHPLVLPECPACMVAGLRDLSCPLPAMGFSEAAAHPPLPMDSVPLPLAMVGPGLPQAPARHVLQGKQPAVCSVE